MSGLGAYPSGTKTIRRSGSRESVIRVNCWWFRKSAESLRNGHQLLRKLGAVNMWWNNNWESQACKITLQQGKDQNTKVQAGFDSKP